MLEIGSRMVCIVWCLEEGRPKAWGWLKYWPERWG